MTRALFTQQIDTAFEEAVGEHGVSRERFHHWRKVLSPRLAQLQAKPPRESVPLFALPSQTDDLVEIEAVATHIAEHFSTLVVVGMGGSSLGGETLAYLRKPGGLKLHFVDNVDPHTLALLIEELPLSQTAVLIVSKSGNTVETHAHAAIFLRALKNITPNFAKHFFVLTIPNDNPLHRLAREQGIRVLAHDPDLGGRFSVLSNVGLLPAAAVGVDIRSLRDGARIALAESFSPGSLAAEGAALHMALTEKHSHFNVLMHYCDRLTGVASWYRQCWAESLGKCALATTPIRSRGATDQHSQLQLYLAGPKDKFFTALIIDSNGQGDPLELPSSDARFDYLKGQTLGDLIYAEQRATNETLVQEGAPLRSIVCDHLDETVMGGLLMHFMLEVVFMAELLEVNAFDQPAIEASKKLTLAYLAGK